jgi:hypothetical protein
MKTVKLAIVCLALVSVGFVLGDEYGYHKYGPSPMEQRIASEGCQYCHRQNCIGIVKTWIDGATSEPDYVCQACGQKLD